MEPRQYIPMTRDFYSDFTPYRWTENPPPPFTPLGKPLAQCRVALIGSGGVYCRGQAPFIYGRDDMTYRTIPLDAAPDDLMIQHYAYNKTAARADVNVVYPLQRFRELQAEGTIGELVLALSFMGALFKRSGAMTELFPPLVAQVQAAGADLAFLVPV